MWLKSLYNIAQMELTTLDILGAFYFVALDADWESRPENILANNRGFRPRPSFTAPVMYGAQAGAALISVHTLKTHAFELQQRTKSDLHAAILASIGHITLENINSKHRFGVGSLSPLDLVTVTELKVFTRNSLQQGEGGTGYVSQGPRFARTKGQRPKAKGCTRPFHWYIKTKFKYYINVSAIA
jgi:hypothetical protein